MIYKYLIKPLFFRLDPEKAHYLAMDLLQLAIKLPFGKFMLKALFGSPTRSLTKTTDGLKFPNPLGLAAGFDKDAKWIDALALLGFGFVEVGTVTPLPQEGNPKPRLFRLPKDSALINRMGFNNGGVDAMVDRLKRVKNKNIIIGGNIGKNKVTPNELAYQDYEICFEKLFPYVHYFVVNVSSPNTPGLRALQEKKPLTDLLVRLVKINMSKSHFKPIYLKIAPDLTDGQVEDIISIVNEVGIQGVITNNTTIDRSNLLTDQDAVQQIGAGGLSGKPIFEKSNEILVKIRQGIGQDKTIIAVGGIQSGEDAAKKIGLGADLIQVYTGFIYEGPSMVRKILKNIKNTI